MRVLLSFMNAVQDAANASVMPCFYEAFVNGLKDAGNDLLVYHGQGHYNEDRAAEKRLYQAVDTFAPELIISFNNYGPNWAAHYDCPIAVYEVDSPLYYGNVGPLRLHPDRYVYFVLQDESRDILRRNFGVMDSHIRPTRNFTAIVAEALPFERNIVFIGSRFRSPVAGCGFTWDCFMRQGPTAEQIKAFRLLVSAVARNPFEGVEDLQRSCPALGVTPDVVGDIVGSLSSQKRFEMLSEIAPLGLELFGTEDWIDGSNPNADLSLAYNPRRVCSVKDNQRMYNSSRLCVNINHCQATSSFSWRVYDIMASRGCLVTEDRPDLKRFFPRVQIPVFSNKFELGETCRKLLRDEGWRQSVVDECNAAMDASCRFGHVLETLEAGLSLKLRQEGRLGSVKYCCDVGKRRSKAEVRRKIASYGIELALSGIPGLGHIIRQDRVLRRIVKRMGEL